MLKRILQSGWFSGALLILMGFFIVSFVKLGPSLSLSDKEVNDVEQKIAEAEKTMSESEKLSVYFNSPAFLERQTKLKLNYKRPDESVVYIYRKAVEVASIASISADGSRAEKLNRLSVDLKKWFANLFASLH